MGGSFLQIFLIINLVFIGVLLTFALQHVYAHFKHVKGLDKGHEHPEHGADVPKTLKQQMLESAKEKMQAELDQAVAELTRNLQTTTEQINKAFQESATKIVSTESERYKLEYEKIRKQLETMAADTEAKLVSSQADFSGKLNESAETHKKELISKIDEKLADAVTSFLMDTLQHEVDLGAQTPYLVSMLEEHKAELIKELGDEAAPTE